MGTIWALAVKDMRLQLADKVGLFFIWFWPLIFVTFFGYVLAGLYRSGEGPRAISVAVVDEDQSAASRELIDALSEQGSMKPTPAGSREEGEGLVRRGRLPACIVIPKGYEAARDGMFSGRVMELDVVVDPSKPMEAAMANGLLQAALFRTYRAMFTGDRLRRARDDLADAPGLSDVQRGVLRAFLLAAEHMMDQLRPDAAQPGTMPATRPANGAGGGLAEWQPFQLHTREIAQASAGGEGQPPSAFAIVVPQGMAWGIMACAAIFATTIVVERTRGTLMRLLIAPVHPWQVLAGKGLACFATSMGVMIGMLVVAGLVFGVRPSSPALLVLALPSIGVAIVGVMMLFSVLGRTEAAVSGLSWAVLVIMAMFGGGMIPLSQLGGGLRTLSVISIFRWMIQVLDGVLWRDYSFAEMLAPCGVLLAIGVAGFALGAAMFRRRLHS